MSAKETQGIRTVADLLPHQVEFVRLATGDSEPKVIVLEGGVGLGKSTALAATCTQLLRTDPSARVLLLAHVALGEQFVSVLKSFQTAAVAVDRYRFREMQDAADGGPTWPSGQVAVLGWDFARQRDVAPTLKAARWGLLVADEAHSATGGRLALLRELVSAADRVVLATATPHPDGFAEAIGAPVKRVRWRRDAIQDATARNLSLSAPPTLTTVSYSLSLQELQLAGQIESLAGQLAKSTAGSFRSHALARALESGPAPLESTLRAIAGEGAHVPFNEDDEDASGLNVDASAALSPEVLAATGTVLSALDKLESDSKLVAFASLLERQKLLASDGVRRVCVVTEFASTLFYLAAELESRGATPILAYGSMSEAERAASFERLRHEGGLLVATCAVLQGIELPDASDVIFYDTPRSAAKLEAILGRFNRVGRTGPLRIFVLASTAAPHPLDEETRRALHEATE